MPTEGLGADLKAELSAVAFGTPQGLGKIVTQSSNSPIARSWLCSILKHLMVTAARL